MPLTIKNQTLKPLAFTYFKIQSNNQGLLDLAPSKIRNISIKGLNITLHSLEWGLYRTNKPKNIKVIS